MIRKLFENVTAKAREQRRAELYRNLIRHEAKIGGQLFGPVKEGGRREFFCLDKHTWIWHEEWLDKNGERHVRTTRYDVRPNAILKAQDNQPYQVTSKEEAYRIYQAAQLYLQRIRTEVYNFI